MNAKIQDLIALGNSEESVRGVNLWALRSTMQKIVSRHVLKDCGHVINLAVALKRSRNDGKSYFGGLSTCSNVWCCPVCSAKISHYRSNQLQSLVDWAKRKNYTVSILTLTMRHNRSQSLKHLWNAITNSFSRVQQSQGFKNFRKDKLIGYVKATEVTYGENGWHVHFHCLIITKGNFKGYVCLKDGSLIEDYFAEKFKYFLARYNVDFIKDSGGMDWQICADNTEKIVAKYVTKIHGDIAKELTLGNFKKARIKQNRTPFQILADIQADNFENKQDIAIFREYEKASYYKLQLVPSRGLYKLAGLVDCKDEDILDNDKNNKDDTILFISREDWDIVLLKGLAPRILQFIHKISLSDTYIELFFLYRNIICAKYYQNIHQ